MNLQPNDNVRDETVIADENIDSADVGEYSAMSQDSTISSEEKIHKESVNYGKKFSAKLYKFFSLLTFFIYYLNCMLRIGMRCSNYFREQGISSFAIWWEFSKESSNLKAMSDAIFDWYTIALLVFLALYSVVFLITFINFSPKHKKTFKFFKKGFVMARRVIKLINVALNLTVLINSAKLASFSDKFMFVISLLSIIFTFMQICVSITSWVVGKKLNKSVKQYVGNIMSNYIASSRVRPQQNFENTDNSKVTIGEKLGKAKNRFLRTIETLTLTKEEALYREAELDGFVIDNNDLTDRFENDYQPDFKDENSQEKVTEKKKSKKVKTRENKKALSKFKLSKSKETSKIKQNSKAIKKSQDITIEEQIASDLSQDAQGEKNEENNEPIT